MSVVDKIKLIIKRYPRIYNGRELLVPILKEVFPVTIMDKVVVYCMSKDYIAYLFTSFVVKLGRHPFVELLSTQELVDVYIGASDQYESISNIRADVVMVYDGMGMPNKQKGNLIVQLMELQRIANKYFILFYFGTESQFMSQFPEIKKELDMFDYKIISVGITEKNEEEIF